VSTWYSMGGSSPPQIREELLNLNPNSASVIDAYIEFLESAPVPGIGSKCHGHHILPQSKFPQYADFRICPWNLQNLLLEDHAHVHVILNGVIPRRDVAFIPMDRTNIYLSKPQKAALGKMAKQKGISVAELIRRIIDKELERKEKS
jgi:hypothetical protein